MIKVRETDIELHQGHFNTIKLADRPAWRYAKMEPGGVNDDSVRYARTYDKHHQAFTNYERQAEEILAFLGKDARRTDLRSMRHGTIRRSAPGISLGRC